MKKLLAVLLAVMMLCSMAMVVNAEIPNEEVEVLQFTTAPKIDGVITEAEWGKPTVKVTPEQATTEYRDAHGVEEDEENIWFDLWLRWDANYYYVGMYLPDTYHALAASEGSLWNGDVVQMGFDPQGVDVNDDLQNPWSEDYTNMSFGLVSGEGNTLSSWAFFSPVCEGEPVSGAKYNVKRDKGFTTYEIAIPWESLGVEGGVKVGDLFGATIARVMADNEEDGYNGWLSWGVAILGKGSVADEDLCGNNGLRISATSATGAAAAGSATTSTTTTPATSNTPATSTGATGATAPVTADAGMIAALITMAASAGAALSIKKRR
ncbi:MAG: hypothetical protein E7588_03770 [Ruminococcaceae bacterium]|nr:hypothetical protein [Oscillospiraceae bacterium]